MINREAENVLERTVEMQGMWNVKTNHLKITQKIPEQHTGKVRNQVIAENRHIGHCALTAQSKLKKNHPKTGHDGPEVWHYSFFHFGARWGELSTPRPGRFTPGGSESLQRLSHPDPHFGMCFCKSAKLST